jgi:hypothetical protein
MIRLYRSAKKSIADQVQCPFKIKHFDRVDKKTGKDYGSFSEDDDEFFIVLTPEQQARLENLQTAIRHRIDENAPTEKSKWGGWPTRQAETVTYMSDGAAYFKYEDVWQTCYSPASHEAAQKHIAALQHFYNSISPDELQILFFSVKAVTISQMEILRSYSVSQDHKSRQ